MRRNVGIDIAWPIHGRELATAQENQVRGQPSALVDPVPDLKWIHGIQALRCFGIGYLATVRPGIIGGVKSEPGAGRHAYPVMRNRTENDGPRRCTITVTDHHLARESPTLISVDVGCAPSASVSHHTHSRTSAS